MQYNVLFYPKSQFAGIKKTNSYSVYVQKFVETYFSSTSVIKRSSPTPPSPLYDPLKHSLQISKAIRLKDISNLIKK